MLVWRGVVHAHNLMILHLSQFCLLVNVSFLQVVTYLYLNKRTEYLILTLFGLILGYAIVNNCICPVKWRAETKKKNKNKIYICSIHFVVVIVKSNMYLVFYFSYMLLYNFEVFTTFGTFCKFFHRTFFFSNL